MQVLHTFHDLSAKRIAQWARSWSPRIDVGPARFGGDRSPLSHLGRLASKFQSDRLSLGITRGPVRSLVRRGGALLRLQRFELISIWHWLYLRGLHLGRSSASSAISTSAWRDVQAINSSSASLISLPSSLKKRVGCQASLWRGLRSRAVRFFRDPLWAWLH